MAAAVDFDDDLNTVFQKTGLVSFKEVRLMRWRRFWEEFGQCTNAKQRRTFHPEDPQLQGLSAEQAGAARSLGRNFKLRVQAEISRFQAEISRFQAKISGLHFKAKISKF